MFKVKSFYNAIHQANIIQSNKASFTIGAFIPAVSGLAKTGGLILAKSFLHTAKFGFNAISDGHNIIRKAINPEYQLKDIKDFTPNKSTSFVSEVLSEADSKFGTDLLKNGHFEAKLALDIATFAKNITVDSLAKPAISGLITTCAESYSAGFHKAYNDAESNAIGNLSITDLDDDCVIIGDSN